MSAEGDEGTNSKQDEEHDGGFATHQREESDKRKLRELRSGAAEKVDLSAEEDEGFYSKQQEEQDGGFATLQQEETDRRILRELRSGAAEMDDNLHADNLSGGLAEIEGREGSKEDAEMIQQN